MIDDIALLEKSAIDIEYQYSLKKALPLWRKISCLKKEREKKIWDQRQRI